MPKLPLNFKNTIIYKIVSITDESLFYIGHTTDFTKTKNRMKVLSLKPEQPKGKYTKLWKNISDGKGWDNFQMVEIQKFSCDDVREAEAEVFRIQQEYRMNILNKQFEADEAKISKGENIHFKHEVKKSPLKYNY